MKRDCNSCGRELDYKDMFCDRCGKVQYPVLRQLLTGHRKLKLSDLGDRDFPHAESKLQPLVSICANLDSVFKSDVNTPSEFDSFFVCVRLAVLLSSVTNVVSLIARSTTKTPDMKAEIAGEMIYFEVTRLIDTSPPALMRARASGTSMDTAERQFIEKIEAKLAQAAASPGPLVLVIESQREWNAGWVLNHIQVDLVKLLPLYLDVSGLILLNQETVGPIAGPLGPSARALGVLIVNDGANKPITESSARLLASVLQ